MAKILAFVAALSLLASSFGAITCPVGSEPAEAYRITGSTLDDVIILPAISASTIVDFYEYGTNLDYSATENIMTENTTSIAVHVDSTTGVRSLILVNGPPLAAGDEYVHMNIDVQGLPPTAQIEVMDDPVTDSFTWDPAQGRMEIDWSWKMPNTDGVAISIPNKDFCVDVNVLSNTYVSSFSFFSVDRALETVSIDSKKPQDSVKYISADRTPCNHTFPLNTISLHDLGYRLERCWRCFEDLLRGGVYDSDADSSPGDTNTV